MDKGYIFLTISFRNGEKRVKKIEKYELDALFGFCYGYRKSNFVDFGDEVININAIDYFTYKEVEINELQRTEKS